MPQGTNVPSPCLVMGALILGILGLGGMGVGSPSSQKFLGLISLPAEWPSLFDSSASLQGAPCGARITSQVERETRWSRLN